MDMDFFKASDGYRESISKGIAAMQYFKGRAMYGKGNREEQLQRLKDEIKFSREQRTRAYTEHVKLTSRVDGIEARVDDIKEELHEHTSKSHQYN